MEGLRKLCDDNHLLLLLDEVQTGWGRTGAPMAYMGYGVMPDAVSMAKAMGGGMPIGACCARKKVAEALGSGTHGSTYGGSPIDVLLLWHPSPKSWIITCLKMRKKLAII